MLNSKPIISLRLQKFFKNKKKFFKGKKILKINLFFHFQIFKEDSIYFFFLMKRDTVREGTEAEEWERVKQASAEKRALLRV